ncbi:hypothetical protein GOODEAATRI_029416 [Goodea atripinnis]|uniref:Uncharacterized protein n=1 Tax=Goodea atripinnis TaxID=208336 RepID=A0ABV0NYP6_9TELE
MAQQGQEEEIATRAQPSFYGQKPASHVSQIRAPQCWCASPPYWRPRLGTAQLQVPNNPPTAQDTGNPWIQPGTRRLLMSHLTIPRRDSTLSIKTTKIPHSLPTPNLISPHPYPHTTSQLSPSRHGYKTTHKVTKHQRGSPRSNK